MKNEEISENSVLKNLTTTTEKKIVVREEKELRLLISNMEVMFAQISKLLSQLSKPNLTVMSFNEWKSDTRYGVKSWFE